MAWPDTIFALSSGRPPAAIAVVRVSGPKAREAVLTFTGKLPVPRQAALMRLRDPGGEAIDDAIVLWFPGPHSETGEDAAEFQVHGGRAVLAALLAALAGIEGLRLAEPGEFTRRAFLNGKVDLTRVEGLADLIGADTEAQRRQALRQLRGLLGERAEQWRRRLIEAVALVEAQIDFPDEGDVPDDLVGAGLAIAGQLRNEIAVVLNDRRRGERLRDGLTVVIAGPVNVGKSSILNRLSRRPAAIVSPYAGTTRDIIEVHLDLGGYPVTVFDTAGLRETSDPVEQEGVRRAEERAKDADLVLWVMDASALDGARPPAELYRPDARPVWIVMNKVDLVEVSGRQRLPTWVGAIERSETFLVSAETGSSFDDLVRGLTEFARACFVSAESGIITRERHRSVLTACVRSLDRAIADAGGQEDIVAEELRLATRELGRLTGRIDVEDVLDVIFRDFCIGK